MGERVLHRQHAAPRTSIEVDPVEPEPGADHIDLLCKQRDVIERRILRLVGVAAAELVEKNGAPPRLSESLQRLEVIMGAPGPPCRQR